MPELAACPTLPELLRVLRSEASVDQIDALSFHLAACPQCVATIRGLNITDSAIEFLRVAQPNAGELYRAKLESLIQSLLGATRPPAASNEEETQDNALRTAAGAAQDWTALLAPPQGPDEVGRLGDFRVLRVIGSGGMGVVFEAEDPNLHRRAALKVPHRWQMMNEGTRERFLREARAMALVKSDHVVTIYQVGQANDTCYLAMEMLEGEPLDRWLHQVTTPPLDETLRIGREIAQALAAAHARGLIHRDIKPANVWLESPARRVKLLDFGLARPQQMDVKLTTAGMILGTPAYMAPEQARGVTIDGRADLFSLGCVLYEMVCGKLPFSGDTTMAMLMAVVQQAPLPPRNHNPSIPTSVNDLILRLLAKNPADRHESAQAVIAQLQAIERTLSLPVAGPIAQAPFPAAQVSSPAIAAGSGDQLAPSPRVVPPGDTPATGPMTGGWAKVLLVEPSRTQSGIIRTYLQKQGVQDIVGVASGQEALRVVRSGCPNAIIGALHLPDMTGVQLALQVRSEFKAAAPGFVLISSEAEGPEVGSLSNYGRMVHLRKPFTPEKLDEALRRVLPPASTTARGKLHVLIVDDSTPVRMHIRSVLTGLGLSQFVEAADGARAVAAVAGGTFHLIVTDYHMPYLDGRGLVGYLKENPATAKVPILMVTTETDPAKLEAVRQLGVTVCDKSFRSEVVREIIDQLLGDLMNEVIREFLIETHENLAQLDLDLVALEKDPRESETLDRVFRTLHTVKGTAGFLGLQRLQAVAHAAENLLSGLREGRLIFNVEIANVLLSVVDAVRQMLGAVEKSESDGDVDFSVLIETLKNFHAAAGSMPTPVPPPPARQVAVPAPPAPDESRTIPSLPSAVNHPWVATESTLHDAAESRPSAVPDSSIRVDVGLLDKLMNLVGELVLARNQIVQFSNSRENTPLLDTVQRLNLLTTELQAGVMKTRMQPISTIWSKFPRVVRDLALACGKQAGLVMEGQETEMDKTIIEAIRDPLTHLVRNAIDHGIEPPAERLKRGKTAEGRLALHAFHESGKVIIEIADDGAGIEPERIRAKAINAKLVPAEQADHMNDRELVNLIFLPGFSMADQVTQLSGRGVGMDVVRTHVEKIGGTVTIESWPGQGTTVRMKIPLTLAIIPALTVTCAGDRYAIPQVSLLELVCLEGEQAQRGVELIHGASVYRLRGNLLPLVYLNRQLWPQPSPPDEEGRKTVPWANGQINLVVLQADDRQFGLIVDAIHDTEEIVVKPLQKQLKGISVFAGATIMGDGKVVLILDVPGLAQQAKVVCGVRQRALCEKPTSAPPSAVDRQTVLLFATHEGGRMAIPLSLVARLEEFPRTALERVGPQDMVKYRDEILPLIHVSRVLRPQRRRLKDGQRGARRPAISPQAAKGDTIQVVVYAGKGHRVGLVVDRILDIAEETIASRTHATRPGVLFTAVVQGRITEFLDVEGIIRSVDPVFFEQPEMIAAKA